MPSWSEAWRHFRSGLTPEALLNNAAASLALSAVGFLGLLFVSAPWWIYAMLALSAVFACSAIMWERAARPSRERAEERRRLIERFDALELRILQCLDAGMAACNDLDAYSRWAKWAEEIEHRVREAAEEGSFSMVVRDALLNPNARPEEVPEETLNAVRYEGAHGKLLAQLTVFKGAFRDARRVLDEDR